jgi:predicted  nucleic acid-binding Zn-ribbon protein
MLPMNFVGKIFVVLILVMSLVFASFAVVTYATHRNWKDAATELNDELQQRQSTLKQLTDRRNALQMELEEQEKDFQEVRVKLENEREQLREGRDAAEQELADAKKELRGLIAAVDTAHAEVADLRAQVTRLAEQIDSAEQAKHQALKEATALTDQVHSLAFQRDQLKKTNTELTREVARLKNILRSSDIDPDTAENPVPQVEGLVRAVEGNFVEVTIGSDDGLKKGIPLQVYRIKNGRSTYVGRVNVVQLHPDKAVATIDKQYQQTNILRGDRVTTKLK